MHAIFGPHQFETLGAPVDFVVYPTDTKQYVLRYSDRKLQRQIIRLGNGTYVEADRYGPENFGIDELSHIVFLSEANSTDLEAQKILEYLETSGFEDLGKDLLKADETIPKRYAGALAVYKTWLKVSMDESDNPTLPFGFKVLLF